MMQRIQREEIHSQVEACLETLSDIHKQSSMRDKCLFAFIDALNDSWVSAEQEMPTDAVAEAHHAAAFILGITVGIGCSMDELFRAAQTTQSNRWAPLTAAAEELRSPSGKEKNDE